MYDDFDFNSCSFPLQLSENIINYLYPRFRNIGWPHYYNTIEKFKEILKGNDRSRYAGRVLYHLFLIDAQKHCNLPPPEFDIISDQIVETTHFPGIVDVHTDTHQGVCRYGDQIFDFNYEVTKSRPSSLTEPESEEWKRSKTKVILQGHTFENVNTYMHEACASYLEAEKEYKEEQRKKQRIEKEKEIWINFRSAHRQELIDWLAPYAPPCDRHNFQVTNGSPSFSMVCYIDHGMCNSCAGHCCFKKKILRPGEHSEKWYELGIDKLGLTEPQYDTDIFCYDYNIIVKITHKIDDVVEEKGVNVLMTGAEITEIMQLEKEFKEGKIKKLDNEIFSERLPIIYSRIDKEVDKQIPNIIDLQDGETIGDYSWSFSISY